MNLLNYLTERSGGATLLTRPYNFQMRLRIFRNTIVTIYIYGSIVNPRTISHSLDLVVQAVLFAISFPEYACSCHYITREQAYSGNEIVLFVAFLVRVCCVCFFLTRLRGKFWNVNKGYKDGRMQRCQNNVGYQYTIYNLQGIMLLLRCDMNWYKIWKFFSQLWRWFAYNMYVNILQIVFILR
jgi:hypothetical protein